MFGLDTAKLQARAVEIIIILVCIVAIIGYWAYRTHEINTLKKENITEKIENKSLNDVAEKKQASDKITEKTNDDIAKGTASVEEKHDVIKQKATDTISNIEKDYTSKISTATDSGDKAVLRKQEDNQTSLVMINSLWDAYCDGKTGVAECQATTTN
jgi:FtsZ-interacting cell division protein ZipA